MGQVKKPQPTIWLDVTKPGQGLVVAWNNERYLLTQEQACRLANVILALLKRPDKADDGHNETAERFFAATLINEPYDPAKIHVSHDLESVGDVGLCKICRQGWMGEVMTPGLSSPCTKVKPQIDPMTGYPVEFMEREGFGQEEIDRMNGKD